MSLFLLYVRKSTTAAIPPNTAPYNVLIAPFSRHRSHCVTEAAVGRGVGSGDGVGVGVEGEGEDIRKESKRIESNGMGWDG